MDTNDKLKKLPVRESHKPSKLIMKNNFRVTSIEKIRSNEWRVMVAAKLEISLPDGRVVTMTGDIKLKGFQQSPDITKTCTKCQGIYPATKEFFIGIKRKSGYESLRPWCRSCWNKYYSKASDKLDIAKLRAYQRDYYHRTKVNSSKQQ